MSLLSTALRYKDILWFRTLAHLKAETNNNYLGYIWLFLEPAISTAILYLVFGVISGNRSSDLVLFILTGMMVWQWFESSIMMGAHGIREKLHILNNVRMPKYLFPVVSVFANTWKFLCVFLILIVLTNLVGFHAGIAYIYIPLVFFVQVLLIIGLTIPFAIFVAYMPDFVNILSSGFRLLFFLSGIFYSRAAVPDKLIPYFDLNPVAHVMDAFRAILISNEAPSMPAMIYCAIFGAIPLTIGIGLSLWLDQKIIKSISA